MKHNKILKFVAPLFSVLPLCEGCGYHAKPMPQISASQFLYKIENDRLQIYVEPFDTEDECKEVFQHNLNKNAYIPIFLRIKNNDENLEIKVDRDNIHFYSGGGLEFMNVHGSRVARTYDLEGSLKSTLTAFIFGAMSGMFSALQEQEKNRAREQDFESKELSPLETIIPGGIEEGFVYFRRPDEKLIGKKEFESCVDGAQFSMEIFVDSQGKENYLLKFSKASNWFER